MDDRIPAWFAAHIPDEVQNSTLFKFDIILGQKKITVDLRSDLDIDYNIIQQELENSVPIFTYWAALHAEVKQQIMI